MAPGQSKSIELELKPTKAGACTEVISIESNTKNTGKGGFVVVVTGKQRAAQEVIGDRLDTEEHGPCVPRGSRRISGIAFTW